MYSQLFFYKREGRNTTDSAIRSSPPAERRMKGKRADLFVALKQNDSPTLVSGRKIVARRIKLNGRDDIGYTQHLWNEQR